MQWMPYNLGYTDLRLADYWIVDAETRYRCSFNPTQPASPQSFVTFLKIYLHMF